MFRACSNPLNANGVGGASPKTVNRSVSSGQPQPEIDHCPLTRDPGRGFPSGSRTITSTLSAGVSAISHRGVGRPGSISTSANGSPP